MGSGRATWIIGDVHGGADAETDADLLALLRAAARRRADVLFMGDLFVAWLGPPRFWTASQRRVLEAIRAVRASGGRARLVVGNRDYLTEVLADDVFDRIIEGPTLIDVGGVPTWVLHGDGIVPEDRAYRAWRALSRSRAVSALLHRLPSFVGRAVPARVARGMTPLNRGFKTGALPEAALAHVASAAGAAGATRCLVGHFHARYTRDVAVGEGETVRLCVVPGFPEHRSMVVATADDLTEVGVSTIVAPTDG